MRLGSDGGRICGHLGPNEVEKYHVLIVGSKGKKTLVFSSKNLIPISAYFSHKHLTPVIYNHTGYSSFLTFKENGSISH